MDFRDELERFSISILLDLPLSCADPTHEAWHTQKFWSCAEILLMLEQAGSFGAVAKRQVFLRGNSEVLFFLVENLFWTNFLWRCPNHNRVFLLVGDRDFLELSWRWNFYASQWKHNTWMERKFSEEKKNCGISQIITWMFFLAGVRTIMCIVLWTTWQRGELWLVKRWWWSSLHQSQLTTWPSCTGSCHQNFPKKRRCTYLVISFLPLVGPIRWSTPRMVSPSRPHNSIFSCNCN